ncbi:MAG: regulatory iron-sulfur-containing complex subunit RicT [Myxococcales bacterium]
MTDADLAEQLALPEDDAGCDDGAILVNAAGVGALTARSVDYDAGDLVLTRGATVLCDAANGAFCARVTVASRRLLVRTRLSRILRCATEVDLAAQVERDTRGQAVRRAVQAAIHDIGLAAKAARVEAPLGNARWVVQVCSEERLPYRDIYRALARYTRERVELRHAGPRDGAQAMGGLGPCGQALCCSRFLPEFAPVAIKMAKDQGLPLHPERISGMCGRLLCCLGYEENYYCEQRKQMPKVGARVDTPSGPGRVRDTDVMRLLVRVVLDSGDLAAFAASEVCEAG